MSGALKIVVYTSRNLCVCELHRYSMYLRSLDLLRSYEWAVITVYVSYDQEHFLSFRMASRMSENRIAKHVDLVSQ